MENWIAVRQYKIKPKGASDGLWKEFCISISVPRELSKSEQIVDSKMGSYGCTVQFDVDNKKRVIYGRDSFEVLFHGILAIERYLILKSKTHEIKNAYGHNFDEKIEGFLWGPVADEYLKNGRTA